MACFALLLCGTGLSTSWLFFAPYLLDSSSMQSLRTVPPSLLGSSPHVLVFFLLPPLWEVPSHCCGFPISPKQPGQTGEYFFPFYCLSPAGPAPGLLSLESETLLRTQDTNPCSLHPHRVPAACSLPGQFWSMLSHQAPSGPCSWVALLVLGSKRHGSFREGVPAVLRDQVPTHVSKCHQWEPRHCNPAHNAPLKTFQQLN